MEEYIVWVKGEQGVHKTWDGKNKCGEEILCKIPITKPEDYGDPDFVRTYGVKYAYYAGAMANGISSVEMIVSLGKEGFMGSFGTGGLSLEKIASSIDRIQACLPEGPFLMNLLASPGLPEKELSTVKLFIEKGVRAIEASAYVEISKALVLYRVSGLIEGEDGSIQTNHHIIAKISREEVAERFLNPAPRDLVQQLYQEGLISKWQADVAEIIPMADDITAEADSGGHTDNRPLISLLPAIQDLRDSVQKDMVNKTRIGAAGGIGTPKSIAAAFRMGAAYVVTGSINQSCVEAGTSDYVKELLGRVKMADVVMAPCADMFEKGVRVEVLKKETMYPQNAQKLYDLYCAYSGIEQIPQNVKEKIEKRIFHKSLEDVWEETESYFKNISLKQLERAYKNPKYKMALIFRWYLGKASGWAVRGETERKFDMQIWCGQSMGAFNNWAANTEFASIANRKAAKVAKILMTEAAKLDTKESCRLIERVFQKEFKELN